MPQCRLIKKQSETVPAVIKERGSKANTPG